MTKSADTLTPPSSNGVKPHRFLTTQAARKEHGDAPIDSSKRVSQRHTNDPATSLNAHVLHQHEKSLASEAQLSYLHSSLLLSVHFSLNPSENYPTPQ
jgi:hypothetical protein